MLKFHLLWIEGVVLINFYHLGKINLVKKIV
jgi:hypothetical protein